MLVHLLAFTKTVSVLEKDWRKVMAEFCKDCASKSLGLSKEEIRRAVFSREPDLCEGCGEWRPVLIEIKDNRLPKFVQMLLFGRYS